MRTRTCWDLLQDMHQLRCGIKTEAFGSYCYQKRFSCGLDEVQSGIIMFYLLKSLSQVRRIFYKIHVNVCICLMCDTHSYICVYMVKPSNSFNSVLRHKAGEGALTVSCGCPGLGLLFRTLWSHLESFLWSSEYSCLLEKWNYFGALLRSHTE